MGNIPECLGRDTQGRGFFFKKIEFLPRVLHSGKRVKKIKIFPECCTRERDFEKKQIFSLSVASREEVFQKMAEGTNGVKPSPSASMTLVEGFLECTIFWHSGNAASP
jgi:hypothetical protein